MADEMELFDPASATVRYRDSVTGETGHSMVINGQRREFADQPASGDEGIAETMLIGAQSFAGSLFDRLDAVGGDEDAKKEIMAEEQLLQPLRERRPFSLAAGESLPGMLVPGGKPTQTLVGIAEGALTNPENPILGGAIGGTSSLVGGEIGERLGNRVAAKWNRFRGKNALAELNERGIPTTAAQRGSPTMQTLSPGMETIPVLNKWLAAPARAQQKALNRGASRSLGWNGDLTKDGRRQAVKGIKRRFKQVADSITPDELPDDIANQVLDLNIIDVKEQKLMDVTGVLDGNGMMRVRSAINSEVASLAMKGEDPAANQLRIALTRMDDFIETNIGDDAVMATWKTARQEWQFKTALESGKALSGDGTVNLASTKSAMEKIYPQFKWGGDLNGPEAASFGQLITALDELPKAIADSGTTSRSAALALLVGGPSLAAVEPTTMLGPLAAIAASTGQPGVKTGGAGGREVGDAIMAQIDAYLAPDEDENDTDPDAAAE